jgi:hypothetical protein
VVVNAAPGSCSASVNVPAPAATDACGEATVSGARSDGQPLNGPYPAGVTTITWTAVDAAGNSSSCQQTVTVIDNIAPVISNASASPSVIPANGALVTITIPYDLSDNCGAASGSLSGSGVEVIDAHHVRVLAEAPGGAHRAYTIVITATDASGNSSTQSVTVTVQPAVLTPCTQLRQVEAQLVALIAAGPTSPAADKLEDVLQKVRAAIVKCSMTPPDRQGAAGELEGAVGDLEAAIKDGLIPQSVGEPLILQMAAVSRAWAVEAINEAIARGGNKGQIQAAQNFLKQGDAHMQRGRYKDACAKFKDAIAKAEGA